jgi:[ribosomal protein S5]-alanine N-acetyltransferase
VQQDSETQQIDESDRPPPTQRLSFGLWKESDTALASAIWGDPAVTELTGGPFAPEAVQRRLEEEIGNWRSLGIQYWPIFRSGDSVLVGSCGLRPRDMEACIVELGFQLCRTAWGQGYAAEAAGSVIGWAGKRGFKALIAGHHPNNEASRRTLLRLGFNYTHDEFYPHCPSTA